MVRNRAHVVEELAEQIPALVARHRLCAEQQVAGLFDRRFQQEARAGVPDVTEAFIRGRARAVVRVRGGGEPALVDAAAVGAECIQIVRMQPEAASRVHERSRHPAGFEAENTVPFVEGVLNV
jgi:hypothetical protein